MNPTPESQQQGEQSDDKEKTIYEGRIYLNDEHELRVCGTDQFIADCREPQSLPDSVSARIGRRLMDGWNSSGTQKGGPKRYIPVGYGDMKEIDGQARFGWVKGEDYDRLRDQLDAAVRERDELLEQRDMGGTVVRAIRVDYNEYLDVLARATKAEQSLASERERCAKVCEDARHKWHIHPEGQDLDRWWKTKVNEEQERLAAAIRSLPPIGTTEG